MEIIINMRENDRELLRVDIDMRMDMAAISKTHLNCSQNKTEVAKAVSGHYNSVMTFWQRKQLSRN